ncbi:aminotransferase class I/II-fold pyridoxal phosphate-dependent enzyme [Pelagicoccus sp. NFK12]|uniref:Aminotransferase class I/II-fold pyridoxal phosphate-dependent enzyme n=1 Tax=Pelagicoccus enzymogenes TaxID=2773457 RepID=A0A927F691_9BACT|nr:aminotransferase class I/II-fold pyridoxal phosphate-dependent enzyme [Pelagicoccus enzymogenes]MBD5779198.1 aminotransferase class I/II-fold pyridoxal phosphate-dependent enzyme [Pelagicoccus enzymogenes]
MESDDRSNRLRTRCSHLGGRPEGNEPYVPPIVQSTLFNLGSAADAESIFSGERPGHAYTRFGNPTVEKLAEAISSLEGGGGALVTSSGNAATLCAVTIAMSGRSGKLVTHPDIYGGSHELLAILSETYGLQVAVVDPSEEASWLDAVRNAGAVLLETPSNPLMRLIDLKATIEAARSKAAPVIVDNTVATPFNQQPFQFGADWVVQSTTKYLNGHSDVVGGCLVKREKLTPQDRRVHKNLGGTVNAMEAWLVLRGMRTFALRMEAHNRNGRAIADWLRGHPAVSKVHYPGNGGKRQAEIFGRQMSGGSGFLAFELSGGGEAADRFLDRMQLITHAVSLGGMESLATRPAMSSHRGMDPEARRLAGITDGLIRLSVGTEAPEDLIADLQRALPGGTGAYQANGGKFEGT